VVARSNNRATRLQPLERGVLFFSSAPLADGSLVRIGVGPRGRQRRKSVNERLKSLATTARRSGESHSKQFQFTASGATTRRGSERRVVQSHTTPLNAPHTP